jgi:hypothetical protein
LVVSGKLPLSNSSDHTNFLAVSVGVVGVGVGVIGVTTTGAGAGAGASFCAQKDKERTVKTIVRGRIRIKTIVNSELLKFVLAN